MRPQYSGRIADAGFDGSSIFFYLALTRVEIPPRAPPVVAMQKMLNEMERLSKMLSKMLNESRLSLSRLRAVASAGLWAADA